MDLVIFGLNHRTAPVAVREKWAFSHDEALQALLGAQGLVSTSENLILSTCNRTEIYSSVAGEPEKGGAVGLEELLDHFHQVKNLRRDGAAGHFYTLRSSEAVEHLFRVAAGLDSMILGEGQILRQLKDALETARQAGSAGKVFLKLFPAALKAGKRTRAETGISEGCLTHGQAAVRIARETLGNLVGKEVLLLGSGKVTELVAQALREEGAARVAVVNRTLENAVKLAQGLGGQPFPLEDLGRLLETADLVISSTGSREPLVGVALLERALASRRGRPLCAIDLAVPRDFDPACGGLAGVSLHNIDDLNRVVESCRQDRMAEVPRAESIVREELRTFLGQMNWIHLDPVIRHIVERFEAIRLSELDRHLDGFPPECRTALDLLTASLVKKFLHFPIEKLKSLRDDDGLTPAEIAFLRRLFLNEPRPPHDPTPGGQSQRHPSREPG
jgi:glutamyl-tRNA reductase